ncbi:MAG: hypothetical protein QXT45_05470 [Candidatus Bilamarchaeaceae archaeon]
MKVKPPKKITINPIEGEFDIITDNNFSYQGVPLNKKLTIYENMAMAVFNGFNLDGVLDLRGMMILEP